MGIRASRVAVLAMCATFAAVPGAWGGQLQAPENDGRLTWQGITFYGVVDIGLQHQTHGAPPSDYIAYSTEPVIQKNSNRSVTALTSSPLSWSRIGVVADEPLGGDWSGVFRFETYFNPTSGDLSDGLKSLTLNNGRPLAAQTANLDSSVAGQLFGGAAYAGFSSPRFGALTFGRQLTPLAEGIVRYDPIEDGQDSGHAFSLLGGSRTAAGGGTTEDTRLDHTLKYAATPGWLHFAALYQFSGAGRSANTALQGQVGASFAGASADAFYARKYDAISASALSGAQLTGLPAAYSAHDSLAATVSDNTAWAAAGSYDLGTVKLFGGYERIAFADPRTPLAAGFVDIGGYVLASVNDTAYTRERVLRVYWAGLKWRASRDFYLAASGYRYRQNSFATGLQAGCSSSVSSSCSGSEQAIGVVGDYSLGRHLDTYLGSVWTDIADGLASGYLNTATVTTTLGVRLRF